MELLLLGIVAGCVERADRPAGPSAAKPPAVSPGITDSTGPATAGTLQPSPDTSAPTIPAIPDAGKAEVQPPKEEPEFQPDMGKLAVQSATDKPETQPALDKPDVQSPRAEPVAQPSVKATEAVAKPKPAETVLTEEDEPVAPEKLDFGEPLVEGLGKNERLHPKQPIWLTKDRKSVVIQALVCQTQAPLEMFACLLGSKEHESVLAVPVKAFVVHAGLLAAGAKQGKPVRFDPQYAPPTGAEIEITVLWKDKDGKTQKARAQDWVRDMTTGKAMAHSWVFAGSKMHKDEETGKEFYLADSTGDLICVSNFSSATLDVPIRSTDSNAALMFEAFTEHIPPLGTPVTMVLTPKQAAGG